MITNQEIKLQKPEQYYGAVYGRGNHKQIWLVFASAFLMISLFSSKIAMTLLFVPPSNRLLIAIEAGVFLLIFTLLLAFGVYAIEYNAKNYQKDIQQARTEYAQTIFKTWVEQKYDVQITGEQALALMDGKSVNINKNDKKRTVNFKRTPVSEKIFTTGNRKYNSRRDTVENWDYNTDNLNLQLIINKKPKPVKEKVWK